MYDNNAESMVLATLVKRPDYSLSSEKLLPEYFHDKFNEAIYYGICELYKNKIKNIDFASLDAVIKTKYGENVLNPTQCSDFLDMANEFARDTLEEYKLFVDNIVLAAYRRETYRRVEKIQRVCLREDADMHAIQEQLREATLELTEKFSIGDEDPMFGDCIQDLWELNEKKFKENGNMSGLPSKFSKLNEYVTYEPGEMVLVAAQRKQGKSAFCLNECLDKLERGHTVLYLDTELTSIHFMNRIISLKAQVDNYGLKSHNLSVAENKRVSEAIEWFKNNKRLIHVYRANWSQTQIYSCALYWKQRVGIDFLIFDYLKSSGEVGASEVYNSLGNKANFIKNNVAGELSLPVLAAAQLNRGGDISDSYKLEMFASCILNICKKTPKEIDSDNSVYGENLGNYKLFVKANRSGECMESISNEYIDLNYVGNHFDFRDIKNTPVIHKKETPYD